MSAAKARSTDPVLDHLERLLPELEALYTDVHAHPELLMQETRTAGLAADRLRSAGYEVTTGVGKPASSASSAMARGRPSCCAPTWTPCRSRR